MFQLGDKPPNPRTRVLWAAVLAMLLCACAQRTATSPQTTAGVDDPGADSNMPEVLITAVREKPLRLAAQDAPARDLGRKLGKQ